MSTTTAEGELRRNLELSLWKTDDRQHNQGKLVWTVNTDGLINCKVQWNIFNVPITDDHLVSVSKIGGNSWNNLNVMFV